MTARPVRRCGCGVGCGSPRPRPRRTCRPPAGCGPGWTPPRRRARTARSAFAHAAVIVRTVAELPPGRALRSAAEADLVGHARVFDPTVLARLGRRLLTVVDPDGDDARDGDALARAEERAARRMEFTLTPDGEGGSWLRGRLDPTGAATVRAALDPLARPRPSAADGPDPRSPGPPPRGRAGGAVPAGPHGRGPARTMVGSARRSWSPSPTRRCGTGSAPRRWTTAPPSPPPKPAGWPATRRSSPPSSAATPNPSTSAAAGDCSPAPPAAPWRYATAAARSPAATGRSAGATPTTSPAGRTAAPPPSTTASCSAGTTTDSSNAATGRSSSPRDGTPEFRPPPWTDPNQRPLRNHMHKRE